jgi:hypothetical protein
MNEEAYHNGYATDLRIGLDQIWDPELWMRSVNVWDMTLTLSNRLSSMIYHINISNKFYHIMPQKWHAVSISVSEDSSDSHSSLSGNESLHTKSPTLVKQKASDKGKQP